MTKRRNRELYRIPEQGKIAGVCAGIAEYFGMETWLVRILVVSGMLLGLHFFIVLYIAGWFILDKKSGMKDTLHAGVKRSVEVGVGAVKQAGAHVEEALERSIKVKAKIWQSGEPPRQAFYDIKRKFNGLESQLRDIEKYVTSTEFTVSREINKL